MTIYDGDVRLSHTPEGGAITMQAGQPIMDAGLETAVYISLFTRKGWWGNEPGEDIGSDLEEILRAGVTPATVNAAVNAARSALAWLKDIGAASEIEVSAESLDAVTIGLSITITEPGKTTAATKRYVLSWSAESRSLEVR